jgi:hypothetical protein
VVQGAVLSFADVFGAVCVMPVEVSAGVMGMP